MLKCHKNLYKIVSILLVQIKTEKIYFKKFLHFKKKSRFNLSVYLYEQKMQIAKYLLTKCQAYIQKKNKI